ncbi:flavin reductase family protein [Ferroglobus sp.]|uniref:flavin reductase family protein n=1 Tax=Ferroglobus sp. TaxID=2614230 RepID=UPI0025C1998A|nr:flavin reductase family protein [Ferroglobus sp.]
MDPRAFYKISYGLYVVSSAYEGKLSGQIANTVFQVSSEPPMIAACLNKKNFTHEIVKASKVFAVSVLDIETPLTFIGRFGFRSSRDFDKFEGVDYEIGVTESPVVIQHASAIFEAKVVKECDVGTHTLFIGEVVRAELRRDSEVLTYADYHRIKKGKTPKTATVYFEK